MTQNKTTCTALIPYTPPEAKQVKTPPRRLLPAFFKVDSIYTSRKSTYNLYLFAFILVSVFTRCIQMHSDLISASFVQDLAVKFKTDQFSFKFVLEHLHIGITCIIVAFLSGFSVFSYTLSFLAYLRFTFFSCYVFFSCIETAFQLSFIYCLGYVCLFAAITLTGLMYFTETSRFYTKHSEPLQRSKAIKYVFLFLIYLFVYLFLTRSSLKLLFSS